MFIALILKKIQITKMKCDVMCNVGKGLQLHTYIKLTQDLQLNVEKINYYF